MVHVLSPIVLQDTTVSPGGIRELLYHPGLEVGMRYMSRGEHLNQEVLSSNHLGFQQKHDRRVFL